MDVAFTAFYFITASLTFCVYFNAMYYQCTGTGLHQMFKKKRDILVLVHVDMITCSNGAEVSYSTTSLRCSTKVRSDDMEGK